MLILIRQLIKKSILEWLAHQQLLIIIEFVMTH